MIHHKCGQFHRFLDFSWNRSLQRQVVNNMEMRGFLIAGRAIQSLSQTPLTFMAMFVSLRIRYSRLLQLAVSAFALGREHHQTVGETPFKFANLQSTQTSSTSLGVWVRENFESRESNFGGRARNGRSED